MDSRNDPTHSSLQAPSVEFPGEAAATGLSRQRFLAGIKRYFWMIMLLSAVGAGLGWLSLKRTVATYEAIAVLEADRQALNVLKEDGLENPALNDATGMNTMVQAITSRSVLERVITALKM